jgi:hypothetical protein
MSPWQFRHFVMSSPSISYTVSRPSFDTLTTITFFTTFSCYTGTSSSSSFLLEPTEWSSIQTILKKQN